MKRIHALSFATSRIPDMPTPKDRMIQVVRWYLGMFHAGRPSEVAKKPYNPIIGETFKCYWNVPNIPANTVSGNMINTLRIYLVFQISSFQFAFHLFDER